MSRKKDTPICDYDRQEKIIEEKRKIFLAKKAGLISSIKLKSSATSPTENKNVSKQSIAPDPNTERVNLPFANDGSFFEQFMKFQTPLSEADSQPTIPHSHLPPVSVSLHTNSSSLPTQTTSPPPLQAQHPLLPSVPVPTPRYSVKQPPLPPATSLKVKTELPPAPAPDPMHPPEAEGNLNSTEHPPLPSDESFTAPPPPPVTLRIQPLRPTEPQLVSAPVFQAEDKSEQPHGEGGEDLVSEFEIGERMAKQLALEGDHAIKEFKRVNQKDGPFSFLCDVSNPVALYFNQKLSEYQHANEPVTRVPPSLAPPAPPAPPAPSAPIAPIAPSAPPVPPSTPTEYTPKRRTRWSDEKEVVKIPKSVLSAIDAAGDQQKQIEVQSALNRLASSIRGGRGQGRGRGRGAKRFCGIKYEYDSDEENEYGTWEHKRRAVEMEKTRETADQLTEQGQGKHHLSDYLPGEEYLRFMTQVERARIGDVTKSDESDYKDHEIKRDNIGYQMLQRAGWHEGQGLGAQQQGIIAPVNKGRSCLDSTGVGSARATEVKSGDDEFSLYRKRMMLAYKFRPNPLNNPRRPYYD